MKHLFTIIRHDIIQHLRSPMLWIISVLSVCVFLITGYFPLTNKYNATNNKSKSSIGTPKYIVIDDSISIGVSSIIQELYDKRLRESFRTYYLISKSSIDSLLLTDDTDNSDNSMIDVKLSSLADSVVLSANVIVSEQSTIEPLLVLIAQSACQLSNQKFYKINFTEPTIKKLRATDFNKYWLIIGLITLSITLSGVYGQLLLRSFSEERTTRLLDILLTTVQPITLVLARYLSSNILALLHISLWIVILKSTLSILGDSTSNSALFKMCGFAFYSAIVTSSLYLCIGIVLRKENNAVVVGYIVSVFTTLPILYLPELLNKGQVLGMKILTYIPLYSPMMEGCASILSQEYSFSIVSIAFCLVWVVGLLSISVSKFRYLIERG